MAPAIIMGCILLFSARSVPCEASISSLSSVTPSIRERPVTCEDTPPNIPIIRPFFPIVETLLNPPENRALSAILQRNHFVCQMGKVSEVCGLSCSPVLR